MTALALDASGPWISLALEREGHVFETNLHAPAKQNEILMRSVDDLFHKAAVRPAELDFVSCTSGPGSFTGLRIALSVTKGLALAQGIPLFTGNTLLCQADAAINCDKGTTMENDAILSMQDARKGSVFALLLHEGKERIERGLYPLEQLMQRCTEWPHIRLCGDCVQDFSRAFSSKSTKLSVVPAFERGFAKELLQRARLRYTIEPQGDSLDCGLDYMKKSEAEESLEARKTLPAP